MPSEARPLVGRPTVGRVEGLDVGDRRVTGPARAGRRPSRRRRPCRGSTPRPARPRPCARRRPAAGSRRPTSSRRRSPSPGRSAPDSAASCHTPTCRPVVVRDELDDLGHERRARRRAIRSMPRAAAYAWRCRRAGPRAVRHLVAADVQPRRREQVGQRADDGLEERPRRGDARVEHVVDERLHADGAAAVVPDRAAPAPRRARRSSGRAGRPRGRARCRPPPPGRPTRRSAPACTSRRTAPGPSRAAAGSPCRDRATRRRRSAPGRRRPAPATPRRRSGAGAPG